MNLKTDTLVGTWRIADGSSDVLYRIRIQGGAIDVQAIDMFDGEVLVISDIAQQDGVLEFSALCRSTGFRAKHEISVVSGHILRQKMTTMEDMVPASPEQQQCFMEVLKKLESES